MANVAAFAKNGYIAGRSGNRFEPQANITRAEVVKLLDNMISDYITESGTVTPKGTGIVIVKASGVTLNRLPHLRLASVGEQWSMSMGTMDMGGVSFADVRIN